MKDRITIVGNLVAAPERRRTAAGDAIANFRVACNQSYFKDGRWRDGETNYYSVSAFRALAEHALASLTGGQRVIVTGSLRLREWESGDKRGISADVEADAVGPDLLFGTTQFHSARSPRAATEPDTSTGVGGWAVPGSDAGDGLERSDGGSGGSGEPGGRASDDAQPGGPRGPHRPAGELVGAVQSARAGDGHGFPDRAEETPF